ncbi:hypothetical protein JM93_00408 [Roseibium hamelinense]|uniref:Uncharacterized protein n=1 Tax=Roseibium hamelinense TaxID=150831 RepID=A0A562TIV0_9HYPH|nr:hypothetical protein JM93_00408 [Roseibium hamelinense]
MGTLLDFTSATRQYTRVRTRVSMASKRKPQRDADIILFPGVRREYNA